MENYNIIYNELYREAILGTQAYANKTQAKLNKASSKANAKYAKAYQTLAAACGQLAMDIVNVQKQGLFNKALFNKSKRGLQNESIDFNSIHLTTVRKFFEATGSGDQTNGGPEGGEMGQNPSTVAESDPAADDAALSKDKDAISGENKTQGMGEILKKYGMAGAKDPKVVSNYLYKMARNKLETFNNFLKEYSACFKSEPKTVTNVNKALQAVKADIEANATMTANITPDQNNNGGDNVNNLLSQIKLLPDNERNILINTLQNKQ